VSELEGEDKTNGDIYVTILKKAAEKVGAVCGCGLCQRVLVVAQASGSTLEWMCSMYGDLSSGWSAHTALTSA
jgi:hypothetical protein